jgi:hypothetical protein
LGISDSAALARRWGLDRREEDETSSIRSGSGEPARGGVYLGQYNADHNHRADTRVRRRRRLLLEQKRAVARRGPLAEIEIRPGAAGSEPLVVDAVRDPGALEVSFVTVVGGRTVGHVALSKAGVVVS